MDLYSMKGREVVRLHVEGDLVAECQAQTWKRRGLQRRNCKVQGSPGGSHA